MDDETAGSDAGRHRDDDDDDVTDDAASSERDMARADVANGEGEPEHASNDTEAKYGKGESPA